MRVGMELSLITGISFSVEWHPVGVVEEDVGYVVVDVGIVRILFPYTNVEDATL